MTKKTKEYVCMVSKKYRESNPARYHRLHNEARKKWYQRPENKEKWKAYRGKWLTKNPHKAKEYAIRSHWCRLKREFGVSKEQFAEMIISQCGRCAICNKPMQRPCVDHCHDTKKVRGLLCMQCNSGIGQFGDSIQLVREALSYLIEHGHLI